MLLLLMLKAYSVVLVMLTQPSVVVSFLEELTGLVGIFEYGLGTSIIGIIVSLSGVR